MADNRIEAQVAGHFRSILALLGEDTSRDGLQETPERYARFMLSQMTAPSFKLTVFKEEGANEPVIISGISFSSLCEHHTLPFMGDAIVGYLPNGHVIGGLSKFARVVKHFAAGLQNQERITRRIGEYLMEHPELKPLGVAVVTEAEHTCMSIRGVQCANARTTIQYLGGAFKESPGLRSEFLDAANRHLARR